MIPLPELAPGRPPCSQSERAAAEALARTLRSLRLRTHGQTLRAPTSPTWVPLLRALLRVWAIAFIAAYRPLPAVVLASVAVIAGAPGVAALIKYVPILGAATQNVVARIEGSDPQARAIVVTAHLDTHPTAGAPMRRMHAAASAGASWIALAAAILGRAAFPGWRVAIGVVAAEALFTLGWLARRELTVIRDMPDDNTSGILALESVAGLLSDEPPVRDVWIVGSGAGTSGGHGLMAFLRRTSEARNAWVVEIDALGTGEVVATPFPPKFPRPGTPSLLVRALVAAARDSGDPLTVRRVRRPHSDARAALRMRTAAIALTAGLNPPAGEPGPDVANAERAARVVNRLARSAA